MRSSSPPSEKKKNSKKQVKRGEGGRSAVREGTGGERACKRGELWGPVHPLPKKKKTNKQTDTASHLVLDQDNNIYLISLSILITCLLGNVWIKYGEKSHVCHFWELKG